jgi:hypothetical protein
MITHWNDARQYLEGVKMKANKYILLTIFALWWVAFTGVGLGRGNKNTTPQDAATFIRAKFDPFGGYALVGIAPNQFRDFDNFQIDLANKPISGEKLDIKGFVSLQSGKYFPVLSRVNLSLRYLSFSSIENDQISYHFNGRFLKQGDFSKLPAETPVLEGVLIKNINGRKVAQSKVRFFYFEPH